LAAQVLLQVVIMMAAAPGQALQPSWPVASW
jgi:hypothetical protein